MIYGTTTEPGRAAARARAHVERVESLVRGLAAVSPEARDDAIAQALDFDGALLFLLPLTWRTHERCLRAVSSNGLALRGVPPVHQNHDVCLAALRQNPDALGMVPPPLLSAHPGLALVGLTATARPFTNHPPESVQSMTPA